MQVSSFRSRTVAALFAMACSSAAGFAADTPLTLAEAQRTALATERASVQLAAERLNTSVALIKALGGGWHRGPDCCRGGCCT